MPICQWICSLTTKKPRRMLNYCSSRKSLQKIEEGNGLGTSRWPWISSGYCYSTSCRPVQTPPSATARKTRRPTTEKGRRPKDTSKVVRRDFHHRASFLGSGNCNRAASGPDALTGPFGACRLTDLLDVYEHSRSLLYLYANLLKAKREKASMTTNQTTKTNIS